jgi:hypothetical protein
VHKGKEEEHLVEDLLEQEALDELQREEKKTRTVEQHIERAIAKIEQLGNLLSVPLDRDLQHTLHYPAIAPFYRELQSDHEKRQKEKFDQCVEIALDDIRTVIVKAATLQERILYAKEQLDGLLKVRDTNSLRSFTKKEADACIAIMNLAENLHKAFKQLTYLQHEGALKTIAQISHTMHGYNQDEGVKISRILYTVMTELKNLQQAVEHLEKLEKKVISLLEKD